jgi:hypothetical protein
LNTWKNHKGHEGFVKGVSFVHSRAFVVKLPARFWYDTKFVDTNTDQQASGCVPDFCSHAPFISGKMVEQEMERTERRNG